ncbi:winged helix-turn-helix transcriptional regulator [Sulfurimonas sp. SAG-AH-194-C20]|nr:metalloregulator ArsR/SmtB family transcription factor [Sulfurimonas sp. SAG-AH-194-C20]MDF1878669.1 winged helix-turn-helix transcriptional regulator [Sulfurimonas sp. SAG-AH-194-C20]
MDKMISCFRVEVDDNLIVKAKETLNQDLTELEQQAKLFALLGNEVRLKIIRLFLCYEKMCVCDLSDVLEMNQSPISQHLRKLKDGGLLVNKRDGMTVFYSVSPQMREILTKIVEG